MITLFLDIHYAGYTLALVHMPECRVLSIAHTQFEQGKLNHIMTTSLVQHVHTLLALHTPAGTHPFDHIAHVIATTGPASFTALRSGLSLLQGIVYGLNCPVFTLTRLEALAVYYVLSHKYVGEISVFLDNSKRCFFHEVFTVQGTHETPQLISTHPVSITDTDQCPGVCCVFDTALENDAHAFVSAVTQYAHRDHNHTRWGDAHDIQPFYGHDPVFKKRNA